MSSRRRYYHCDMCDGTGWVEGGAAIKTTCARCEGAGTVKASRVHREWREARKKVEFYQEHGRWP